MREGKTRLPDNLGQSFIELYFWIKLSETLSELQIGETRLLVWTEINRFKPI